MKLFKDSIVNDENLSLPLEIEGGHWDGTFRYFLWALSGFVTVLVLLASMAPVREVALAEGEIIPVGSIATVEHLEGGIVEEIFAREGAVVKAGDLLVRLRSESGGGDFNQITVRKNLLEMRRLRLLALLQAKPLQLGELGVRYPEEAEDQHLLLNSERNAVEAAKQILAARLDQRKAELNARIEEKRSVNSRVEIFRERLMAQRKLVQQGYSSRSNLLEVKARLEEVRAQRAQLEGAVQNSKSGILEIENEIVQAKNQKRQEWSDLLLATIGEVAELNERLTSSQDRVNRLDIKAPGDGRIQTLAVSRPGNVIKPGDLVAEIVPIDANVEAEVRITPRDIGHIAPGHAAEITLSTFDAEIFGKIDGEVHSISPTTFETQEGEKYYRGLVRLDRNILSRGGKDFPISAGMVASASIQTGSKTVMQYLLKPIIQSYDRAFSER